MHFCLELARSSPFQLLLQSAAMVKGTRDNACCRTVDTLSYHLQDLGARQLHPVPNFQRGVCIVVKWIHQKGTENVDWGKVPIYFISFLDEVQLGDCCCCCCSGLANIQVRALTKCPFLQASIGQLENEQHWLAHCITSALRSARETGLFQTVWIGSISRKWLFLHILIFSCTHRGSCYPKISGLGISSPDKHPVLAVIDAHQKRRLNFELAPESFSILLFLSMSTDIPECSKV